MAAWKCGGGCEREVRRRGQLCGVCHEREADARLARALARLAPGEAVDLGNGWAIVRRADVPAGLAGGYMARRAGALDFGPERES